MVHWCLFWSQSTWAALSKLPTKSFICSLQCGHRCVPYIVRPLSLRQVANASISGSGSGPVLAHPAKLSAITVRAASQMIFFIGPGVCWLKKKESTRGADATGHSATVRLLLVFLFLFANQKPWDHGCYLLLRRLPYLTVLPSWVNIFSYLVVISWWSANNGEW